MKIFFVDSENVGCQGLRGMTELSKDDIIYFLTNLAFQECTVPPSFAFALKASPARFYNVPLNTRRSASISTACSGRFSDMLLHYTLKQRQSS